jgi:SSS family solute:Na+ symporter
LGVESALDVWWALASLFSGGILGLFLLGLLVEKPAAKITIVIGLLFILWSSLSNLFPNTFFTIPLHANYVIIVSTILIFLIGLLGRKRG